MCDEIASKLTLDCESLGEHTLKNIDEPVRVYRVRAGSAARIEAPPTALSTAAGPRLDGAGKPSVAVLPFANMSDDPEQEHFTDGITDDIITDLAKIGGLAVVARNSTFTYKNRAVRIADVGRELGVRYVLEGSVRKVGEQVRITAQLVDAASPEGDCGEEFASSVAGGEKMRHDALILLLGLFFAPTPAAAQVSIGIGLPSVSIGINLPSFPELVVVPDYPVYYAPRGDVNLFFYDGMYWAYERDNWYASSWYNGPWGLVGPEVVPVFVLRIPVRYYRHPPVAWAGWRSDGPPRWGERWGHDWEQRRGGWDRWDRRARHAPAPLPVYQRQYSGDRYPRVEQQQVLQREKYRYEPKEPVVREHVQRQRAQSQPAERRAAGTEQG